MKHLYILVFLIVVGQSIYSQEDSQEKLLGTWKLEKMVISPEMFFDINNKDSTRRNFLKQQKEKNYNSDWTFEDSSTVERIYEKAISDIEQMFLEFKADRTYTTNAFN